MKNLTSKAKNLLRNATRSLLITALWLTAQTSAGILIGYGTYFLYETSVKIYNHYSKKAELSDAKEKEEEIRAVPRPQYRKPIINFNIHSDRSNA